MLKFLFRTFLFFLILFILPALAHLGLWSMKTHPTSWRNANWSSAGVLPTNPKQEDAIVYVLAARTGGMKGAFATHSWLVLKKPGQSTYDRYDVVGWGTPVRKNAYDPDGRWYSNTPEIQATIKGPKAARLIPQIETAISNYRWNKRGDYTLWPGPNSNTFIATIINKVPGFSALTPSTAVGRDYPADGRWIGQRKDGAVFASAKGYAGVVIGKSEGFELNFLGLVAGINPMQREVKVPAFGAFRW